MSTSIFSLIFAGVVGVGTFAGTLQQNLSHSQAPEIDKLFWEIEKDIRKFSDENPIDEEEKEYIKATTSLVSSDLRKERSTDGDEVKKPENTLNIWTDIWVQLVSDYLNTLWSKRPVGKRKHWIISTIEEKNKALKIADEWIEKEKKKFKEKLSSKQSQIEEIYQKMREFALLTNFPKGYSTGSVDYPYEHHIKEILKKSE